MLNFAMMLLGEWGWKLLQSLLLMMAYHFILIYEWSSIDYEFSN